MSILDTLDDILSGRAGDENEDDGPDIFGPVVASIAATLVIAAGTTLYISITPGGQSAWATYTEWIANFLQMSATAMEVTATMLFLFAVCMIFIAIAMFVFLNFAAWCFDHPE